MSKNYDPIIRKIRITRSLDVLSDVEQYHLSGVMTYDERRIDVSNSILQDAKRIGRVECELELVNTYHNSTKRVGQIVRRGESTKDKDTNYERWIGPDVAIIHDAGHFSALIQPIVPFSKES